jgi:hypothetical protein
VAKLHPRLEPGDHDVTIEAPADQKSDDQPELPLA